MRRRLAAAVQALLVAGCAAGCAPLRTQPPLREEAPPCAAPAPPAPETAICGRDEAIRSLRARFRADVEAGGGTRTAEGVLVWRAPGALRVKLFTLAGLTVYDALLVGDGTRVRGVVKQPLAARSETFDVGPDETVDAPDTDLSLVLWSLWQPRCGRPPAVSSMDPARFALDPDPARANGREVMVEGAEVREEVLERASATNGSAERVVARYTDYDCTQTPPLPRRIEIEASASGWRARVTILEQARNVALDDALFALPEVTSGDAES